MANIQVSDVRDNLSDCINRSHYGKERLIIERHGKPVAALVSVDDAKFLMELEASMDLAYAWDILAKTAESDITDWDDLKADLGL